MCLGCCLYFVSDEPHICYYLELDFGLSPRNIKVHLILIFWREITFWLFFLFLWQQLCLPKLITEAVVFYLFFPKRSCKFCTFPLLLQGVWLGGLLGSHITCAAQFLNMFQPVPWVCFCQLPVICPSWLINCVATAAVLVWANQESLKGEAFRACCQHQIEKKGL